MLRRIHTTAAKAIKFNGAGGVIVVLAAVFVVAIFSGLAMATERAPGFEGMLFGKITAVDAAHPTKSITLHAWTTGEPVMNFITTGKTDVQMCKEEEHSLKDIRVGTEAKVSYHELAGLAVADYIYVPCT